MFDFGEALAYMKCGMKVANDRATYFIENNKMYCIPNTMTSKREVVRVYTDAILTDNWTLCDE